VAWAVKLLQTMARIIKGDFMALTKVDLINQVYKTHSDFTKAQAREAVEATLNIMKSNLENGHDVLLSNFGKFNIKDKTPRRGRNPQTGESMMLEARKVVTFRPSGNLRAKLNGK
jgi:integration host factor subunit alpha